MECRDPEIHIDLRVEKHLKIEEMFSLPKDLCDLSQGTFWKLRASYHLAKAWAERMFSGSVGFQEGLVRMVVPEALGPSEGVHASLALSGPEQCAFVLAP